MSKLLFVIAIIILSSCDNDKPYVSSTPVIIEQWETKDSMFAMLENGTIVGGLLPHGWRGFVCDSSVIDTCFICSHARHYIGYGYSIYMEPINHKTNSK
jgi:hypothetical protein